MTPRMQSTVVSTEITSAYKRSYLQPPMEACPQAALYAVAKSE